MFAWFGSSFRCPHCRVELTYDKKLWESALVLVVYLAIWIAGDYVRPPDLLGKLPGILFRVGLMAVAFLLVSFGAGWYLRARRSLVPRHDDGAPEITS